MNEKIINNLVGDVFEGQEWLSQYFVEKAVDSFWPGMSGWILWI